MSDDAVVIGSGPNGLVAANLLADAGWQVVVLEAQPQIGGAVASDEEVHPGYVHDTFSSFYPLAAASPTIQRLELERHGLAWTEAPTVLGSPLADGEWALLHRDPAVTASELDRHQPGDGAAWMELCREWEVIGDAVVGALLSPWPPLRSATSVAARMRHVGGLDLVRRMLAPVRAVAGQQFRGEGAQLLFAGNAAHADISLDAPGSWAMGWLLTMIGQHRGFPVPTGGAGMLARALADRLEGAGGRIRTSTRVTDVVVTDGRATGVRTEHGDVVTARKAVIADVSAPALYGGLVAATDLPDKVRRRMRRFEWDPGTVKVDWALDGPVPWERSPSAAPGTVHLAESVQEIAEASMQVAGGVVPARPFLMIGQMATTDPTRAPAGAESLWAYTHVPQHFREDGGRDGITGRWDRDDVERMADRMQARIERYAPTFADRIVARRVLAPTDLEARDENLVNGALNGGTANLQQQLVLRPIPGLGRPETPIGRLYLGSASAHPGGGVHGACGANAARAALAHAKARRLWSRP